MTPTAHGMRVEKIKTRALQDAIFNSAYFSSIATDERGVIQIFNVGAERMLGYAAADVVNQITPADISDPQELVARATKLSLELDTPWDSPERQAVACGDERQTRHPSDGRGLVHE